MAAFTAQDVKTLREKTGCGMMDCKKALTNADGDMDKAIDFLREQGLAKAAKKASRIAAEGVAYATTNADASVGVVIEVNAETDFVAKNDSFMDFVKACAQTVIEQNPADVDELLTLKAAGSEQTVAELLQEKIQTIGENIKIRRFERMEGACVAYVHAGGKIGVLVNFTTDIAVNDEFIAYGKDVAMQIAAMSPQYVSREDISDEELAKMREITIDSALNDVSSLPKPIQKDIFAEAFASDALNAEDKAVLEEKQNDKYLFNFLSKEAIAALAAIAMSKKEAIMANKIFNGLVEGRISKQLKEVCLLDQTYVMAADGKQTVAKYLEMVSKEVGTPVELKRFVRFETGEGLEKKNEDFAAEVAAQMNA